MEALKIKDNRDLNWNDIANSPNFVELHNRKSRFLFGWWFVSIAVLFALPLGWEFWPGLWRAKVIGNINCGYFFVICQFILSFFVAILYTKWANQFSDPLTEKVRQEIEAGVRK